MKKWIIIAVILLSAMSCKILAKGALKYWTKKQVKEFVTTCEEKSSKIMSADKAKKYCECAVDEVAEKYRNYDDVKKVGIVEVLKIAKNCK